MDAAANSTVIPDDVSPLPMKRARNFARLAVRPAPEMQMLGLKPYLLGPVELIQGNKVLRVCRPAVTGAAGYTN
jgi:hypothetical protein